MRQPRIALATEFLVQYGGAQKTLEAIAELFPEAPIFTAKYDSKLQSDFINKRNIVYPKGSFTNSLSKHFFVFAMAPIFESMDFRDYDIVISDGTTWTKGIITKPAQLHFSYVHTPPRFLYGYSHEGTKWEKGLFKPFYGYLANILRMWDYVAAQRPDYLLTNSKETAGRIKKFYGRDAKIIYPPVDVDYNFKYSDEFNDKQYFAAIGRLASYKNFELLIKVFNKLEKPLVIIGTGSEERKLKEMAKSNIKFLGKASEELKHQVMENCIGLINPVDYEDFGIVPIEAMAHGKPVLAHRSGGHIETVIEGKTGTFFDQLTEKSLEDGVHSFETQIKGGGFDSQEIKEHAHNFSKEKFQKEFKTFIDEKWASHIDNA
jgi:glycosyltransferase involved in cell wall biosynthesis